MRRATTEDGVSTTGADRAVTWDDAPRGNQPAGLRPGNFDVLKMIKPCSISWGRGVGVLRRGAVLGRGAGGRRGGGGVRVRGRRWGTGSAGRGGLCIRRRRTGSA